MRAQLLIKENVAFHRVWLSSSELWNENGKRGRIFSSVYQCICTLSRVIPWSLLLLREKIPSVLVSDIRRDSFCNFYEINKSSVNLDTDRRTRENERAQKTFPFYFITRYPPSRRRNGLVFRYVAINPRITLFESGYNGNSVAPVSRGAYVYISSVL